MTERRLAVAGIAAVVAVLAGVPLLLLGWTRWQEDKEATRDLAEMEKRFEAKVEELRKNGERLEMEQFAPEEPAEGENGAVVYEKAFAAMDSVPSADWKAVQDVKASKPITDDEEADKIWASLEKCAEVMALLKEAGGRPKCVFSVDYSEASGFSQLFLVEMREGARLTRVSAKVKLMRGKADEATADCAMMLGLGKSMNGPFLISLLVRMSIEGMASGEVEEVMNESEPSEEALRGLIAAMGEYGDRNDLIESFKFERASRVRQLAPLFQEESFTGIEDPRLFIRLKRLMAHQGVEGFDYEEKAIALAAKPWHETAKDWPGVEKVYVYKDNPTDAKGVNWDKAESWPWMKYLIAKPTAWDRSNLWFNRNMARMDLMKIAVGLRLYRMKNGEYPEKLEGLVPRLMEKLPTDPFSGKSYVYRREGKGFVVYSLNENMVDDGGTKANDPDEGDIVWKCGR